MPIEKLGFCTLSHVVERMRGSETYIRLAALSIAVGFGFSWHSVSLFQYNQHNFHFRQLSTSEIVYSVPRPLVISSFICPLGLQPQEDIFSYSTEGLSGLYVCGPII